MTSRTLSPVTASAVAMAISLAFSGGAARSAVSTSHRITATSVGPVKLGMTVAQARRVLAGYTLRRGSDGEGVALIEVRRGGQEVMKLFADEPDPARPINARARVRWIEVWDNSYTTRAGVHPGMPLREVEQKYGKLKQITRSEIESREYATFAKEPAGLQFRVEGSSGEAGRYPNGSNTATAYVPSARVVAISIRK
jgi:hypothetical protein